MSEARGPNVRKLIVFKASRDAIPDGGGMADGMRFLTDPTYRKTVLDGAERWVIRALDVVKTSPDNPYGHDDEAIAAAILERIDDRRPQWLT